MGYVKSIVYGKNLELYIYEKDIVRFGRDHAVNRKSKGPVVLSDMVDDGVAQLNRTLQKRQDNKRRSELAFRRIILSNLKESQPPLLVTCTYAENQQDIRIGYEDFQSFIKRLRSKYGSQFSYIAVPEFQRRGALHFHALFWSLPENAYKEERRTRMVASLWGKGFVDAYLTDNDERISSYLAKYMSKSNLDRRLLGKKAYRCSRNIKRPTIEKNTIFLYVEEKYGLVDKVPVKQKDFMTQWLGKGRYSFYNNLENEQNCN